MRVVSLNCSNTEIVCGLGCGDYLVGVDSDSDYPPDAIDGLPRVGRDLDIEIDKVRALKPDLVLASLTVPGHEKVIENLKRAKLNYIAPEPISLNDIYRDIRDIARCLNVENRAEAIVAELQTQMPLVERTKNPSILVQWWPNPVISPGTESWVHDLIHLVGAQNPLADRQVKSTPLSDEEVAELNPDAIVISWCGVKTEKYRPEIIYRNENFSEISAIKNKRIYCVPEAFLGRPSQRIVEGYRSLGIIANQLNDENH